ncbi:MAG: hypothetical protein C5B50_19330 [Verrucomicrobia bacterium]|nr:MAG: hypothetical protein C5B50_19330 [Verrucomicrobiota bacterium]
MAAPKKDTILVTCPKCGHQQPEPRGVFSTRCKKCHEHIRMEDAPSRTPAKLAKPVIEVQRIRCFQCGADLEVPKAATSSMCKKCSSHIDLSDYHVTQTVSKNFRTHGRLVVEEKGYVLNTNSVAGEAIIKGRLIGKLATAGRMEIYSTANIKGSFDAGQLVVPAGNHFRWPEALRVGAAEIAGELAANLTTSGTVTLKSSARFFGNLEAGNLVVEAGAVFVGEAKVGVNHG